MAQTSGQQGFQERTLIISGLSATFAKDHDLIGSQDPYFTLTLSGDTVTTKTIKSGGVNPVWPAEEGYRLHDRGEHPELLVHAWNKNSLLKDSSLGEGKIPMVQLGTGQQHTVPLYDKKGKESGQLKFKAQEEQAGSFGSDAGTGAAAAGHHQDRDVTDSGRDGKTAHLHKDKTHDKDAVAAARTHDTHDSRDGDTANLYKGTAREGQSGVAAGTYDNQGTNTITGDQTGLQQDHRGRDAALAAGAAGAAGAAAGAAYGHQGDSTRDGQTAHLHSGPATGDQSSGQTGNLVTGGVGAGTGSGSDNQSSRATGTTFGAGGVGGGVSGSGDTQSSSQTGTTFGAGGVETTTTRRFNETNDRDVNESSEFRSTGGGKAVDLESSDDHWQRSLEAAQAARKQAKIVEEHSRITHEKMLAAQDATRGFEKARREHMAIQERLAALDLEAKRAAFARSTETYEAHKRRISGKAQEVDALQQEANALRAAVNEKGEALDAEVNETKLHQSWLATLDSELARLKGLHSDADRSHQAALAELEPKRNRHRSLQDEFSHIQAELADHQRRRAQLEAKEREMEALLQTHNAEFTDTNTDIEEMEEMGRRKAADAEARRGELGGLEAEVGEVQAALAEHRRRIGVLKEQTEASLANANQLSDAAARKEAELQASQQVIDEKERAAGAAAQALSQAQAQQAPLQEKVRKETSSYDHQKEVTEELHRKLGMAKEQVDLAQARKEELWAKAKWHGEQADKASDTHFLHAHADHKFVSGSETYDADKMTQKSSTTAAVLEKAGEKIGL
jgi:uncharacterized protein YoxC